ncbi:MAG: enoyl-CoA hydratase/isomerase family protein [Actinobacteria bacterium]|nr:enoyl-CoA hydratase/isomerase family protein [Actinomycetota bacterium]
MTPVVWSADEASERLSGPTADLDAGALRGVPAIVVDDAHLLSADALDPLGLLPVVSIGIVAPGGDAPGFDAVAGDPASALLLAEAVHGRPNAATALAQVLRASEGLPIEAALLLESTAYATLQAGPEFAAWLSGRGRRVRPDEPEPPVLVDDNGARVHLTLNRPRLRNLFSAAMRDALVEALRGLAAGDDRPIVLDGAGPAFCAGGDTAEFGRVDDPATAHLIRTTANAAPWMDRLADRLTVRVHGAAVGAGVELATFALRVEARADATFCLPEVSMGLIPGAGGTVSVPRRIGRQRTMAWCLEGEAIDAATALDWGLIDRIA